MSKPVIVPNRDTLIILLVIMIIGPKFGVNIAWYKLLGY